MQCACMFKFFLFLDPNMDDEDELEDLSEEEHTPQGIYALCGKECLEFKKTVPIIMQFGLIFYM